MVSVVYYRRVMEVLKDGELYTPALRTAVQAFTQAEQREAEAP